MVTLPQEIVDKIFLELDYETLNKSRVLQSEYVKNITKYKNINQAIENGNLGNTRWLKEQGCPWDEYSFSEAAKNGNLENMKWLKEQGCPWNSYTLVCASLYNKVEITLWLIENGCPTE